MGSIIHAGSTAQLLGALVSNRENTVHLMLDIFGDNCNAPGRNPDIADDQMTTVKEGIVLHTNDKV